MKPSLFLRGKEFDLNHLSVGTFERSEKKSCHPHRPRILDSRTDKSCCSRFANEVIACPGNFSIPKPNEAEKRKRRSLTVGRQTNEGRRGKSHVGRTFLLLKQRFSNGKNSYSRSYLVSSFPVVATSNGIYGAPRIKMFKKNPVLATRH